MSDAGPNQEHSGECAEDRRSGAEPSGGEQPDTGPAGQAYDWYQRAMALLSAGSADAALQLLDRVREVEPRSRSVLEAVGRAAFDARRYDESVAAFTELLDLAPDDDYAHYGLGLSLWRQQRFIQARDHLGMAFVMRPDQSAYGTALSQVKATLRARVEAGLPLEGPIEVPPGDVREQVIQARAFGTLDARGLIDEITFDTGDAGRSHTHERSGSADADADTDTDRDRVTRAHRHTDSVGDPDTSDASGADSVGDDSAPDEGSR